MDHPAQHDVADVSPAPVVVVEPDADQLARRIAAELVDRLAAAQQAHGHAHLVLTGGGIGIAALEQVAVLAVESGCGDVDWHRVHVWWGDERFVPGDSDERNERGARAALLDRLDLPPGNVHAMPASDAGFASPEDVAAWYAGELAAAAPPGDDLPRLDVLLLGMGPEGHVASIFPESPASRDKRLVLAVHDCPKPPPTRISLGLCATNSAEEVWLLVAGEGKAEAVAQCLGAENAPVALPAGAARGVHATRWLLDQPAASRLPAVAQG
ncbi:MAG: 6-phosphogluconolactonase [Motilibacteraceae bacterium]